MNDEEDGPKAPITKTVLDWFWTSVNASLDEIERTKPNTADGVIEILNRHGERSSGQAFFPGGGGDRSFRGALTTVGWHIVWAEADYYYVAEHPATGELLTYIEGDIYKGDAR